MKVDIITNFQLLYISQKFLNSYEKCFSRFNLSRNINKNFWQFKLKIFFIQRLPRLKGLKGESLELNYFGNKNAEKRTEEFSKNLSNEIDSNQNVSIRQIANNQAINPDGLSKETVRRELKQLGFNSYKLGQRLPSTENS